MQDSIHVNDIKLASILIALGIPKRQMDPITCIAEMREGRRFEQYTFWFDVSDPIKKADAKVFVDAYIRARDWKEIVLDIEHPIYWMKGVLENRECFLNWIRKDVEPQSIIQYGNKTVLIGEKASRETREKIKRHL